MALVYFPTGIGEALGDLLVTCSRLYVNNTNGVWYVDSQTGDDGYDGLDRMKPFATLGTAVAASSDGDVIVMLSGHTETIDTTLDISNLTLVGAGSSGGLPTVKLTNDQADGEMFDATPDYGVTQLLNIWFTEETQANASPKILAQLVGGAASVFRMRGCYVECGQYDDAAGLVFCSTSVGGACILEDTTFISVGTDVAAQPYTGIYSALEGQGGATSLITRGLVLDNGTVGWSNYYAMAIAESGGIACLISEETSLLRGADISAPAAMLGYLNIGTGAGGARVDWTG
jgi:hypothetical protein